MGKDAESILEASQQCGSEKEIIEHLTSRESLKMDQKAELVE